MIDEGAFFFSRNAKRMNRVNKYSIRVPPKIKLICATAKPPPHPARP